MMEHYGSLPCSQEQEEASLEEFCSDGEPYAQLNLMPTQHKFSRNDKMMDALSLSRFGLTLNLLTEEDGEAVLMSFLEDFPVRTYQQQDEEQELTEADQASGSRWQELSLRYDLDSRSWRTHLCLWDEALPWSSVILPRWGMTVSGVLFQHPTAERPISGTGSGLWLTPRATDTGKGEGNHTFLKRMGDRTDKCAQSLAAQVNNPKTWPTPPASDNRDRGNLGSPATLRRKEKGKQISLGQSVSDISGALNPPWVEWLMGWPLGWTDLKPLATAKFLVWQKQHSES
jgi:hypothetical protein